MSETLVSRGPSPAVPRSSGEHSDYLSLLIGKNVFVRTATYAYTGRLIAVTDRDLALEDAAWIADSGRWATTLKNGFGDNAEIEPYPDGHPVVIERTCLIETTLWPHPLPREQR